MTPRHLLLREALERIRKRYGSTYLSSDPLQFPRRFRCRDDREVVGLVASGLAYGNVRAIHGSIERVLEWMGPRPAEFARRFSPKEGLSALGPFRHRWTSARDVACLVLFAGRMLERDGSIEAFFAGSYVENDMEASLLAFARRAFELDHGGLYRARRLPTGAGVRFFFTSPLSGACKRMNMFLRWMVRPNDGLDLGLWNVLTTRELVIPLDTHVYRIGRHLGWTERKTAGWKAAIDITAHLAELDPEDPVKYDFALSRMGILENCPRHPSSAGCDLCGLGARIA